MPVVAVTNAMNLNNVFSKKKIIDLNFDDNLCKPVVMRNGL